MKELRIFAGLWISLFFLFLPFPMEILPEIGTHLSRLGVPLTAKLSGTKLSLLEQTAGHSDSIHQYLITLFLAVIAGISTFLIVRKDALRKNMQVFLPRFIRLVLAFFLLKYGIEKITQLQFPEPPPNILHTPLGKLDKDMLFWSTMGTSGFYGWFMGIAEILAGILLIPAKTRYIGALLSTGIFANVFAINIGFDITVKLLSFALLSASIFVFAPALSPLLNVLTGKATMGPEPEPQPEISPILRRALKGIAVFAISLECLVPLFTRERIQWESNDLPGNSFVISGQFATTESGFPQEIKRIHFHPGGYLIIETADGDFISESIRYHKGYHTFKRSKNGQKVDFKQHGNTWVFTSNKCVILVGKRIENSDLPVLQDTFHWTVEGMMPE